MRTARHRLETLSHARAWAVVGEGGLKWAVTTACMLLAACTTMQPEPPPEATPPPEPPQRVVPPPPPPRQTSDAESLISFYAHLRKLSAPELAREHEAARQAYGRGRSDYNAVRFAMVVAVPNTAFYDEPRALDLLDPVARNGDPRLSGLAALLVSQIQERRRLDATAQALQQKLDALKSLERSLIERKR